MRDNTYNLLREMITKVAKALGQGRQGPRRSHLGVPGEGSGFRIGLSLK